MPRKFSNLALCGVFVLVISCVTSIVLVTRASITPSQTLPQKQVGASTQNVAVDLLLQPEAARLSRRLGKRFGLAKRASMIAGDLIMESGERPITVIRRQDINGENVELNLAGQVVTWSAKDGTKVASGTVTETERLFIERLICDSPDYFILAQLRGTTYYTVARNVRPDNAPDNYDGPLWTVVRIEERLGDKQTRLGSNWRLFYLNTSTGLIDQIVTEVEGQRVEAKISDWTERSGEKFPSTITWTSHGNTLMTFKLTNASIAME